MKKSITVVLFAISAYGFDTLKEALKGSDVFGYAKIMYIFDDRRAPKLDQSTWGAGGKIALKTGEWRGLSGQIAYYTVSDLGLKDSNPKKIDAYMFDIDKKPYSIIGEGYLKYERDKTTLKLGRQEIETPLVSTYEYRVIPNLFEAYTITNSDIGAAKITLSYITKMSGLDGVVSFKNFESMSEQTYTSLNMNGELTKVDNDEGVVNISKISGHTGVIMSGIDIGSNPSVEIWNYYCKDVSNSFYLGAKYDNSLNKRFDIGAQGQFYSIKTIGKFENFLKNLSLNGAYELYGLKATLKDKQNSISYSLAYNIFTGNEKTVTAFGNWGGYPEFVSIPYMFAQEDSVSAIAKLKAAKVSLKYDLKKIGALEQSVIAGYSRIDIHEQIMPNSDIGLINLVYKAAFNKKINAKIQYEDRSSDNYRYNNDILTCSLSYLF